ncbi:Aste57867_13888 [Aphanomyces stellatus]|uniref:Aste57867_13888 protein n=1 Tax=Aphanomyces stellatus TaxID=120398 RepID=A0A485KZZ9_9STRA|nr:hypothetical protein As57867_013837 [Aphanomyces stellatus]VFT90719.1 Aste57867_13888 [Aphanomyces stellatus]
MGEDEHDDSAPLCRYCFGDESDGPLISPCNCSGGQKHVHLECLRRWQRMVLVSQPTHPAFYTDDKRHHICNVCLAQYTCPPPTRTELMESFTGPEIAALIDEGRLIAASPGFSDMLAADRNETDSRLRRRGSDSYDYWFHGVYLITSVKESGDVELPLATPDKLAAIRRQLTHDNQPGDEFGIDVQDMRYVLVPRGSLDGVAPGDMAAALDALQAPATLAAVARATQHLRSQFKIDGDLVVQHYAGGPCDQHAVAACVVRGGTGRGWTVLTDLEEALALAYRRRQQAHGNLSAGVGIRLCGLQSRPELNEQLGLALRFDDEAQRWEVRVGGSGEGIKVKPANMELLESEPVHVCVFWGEAQWSRAQLLGEIARGSWGLCRADIEDLLRPIPLRWDQLQQSGRLAFAPVTEMTEEYIRNATTEMQTLRANAVAAVEATRDDNPAFE